MNSVRGTVHVHNLLLIRPSRNCLVYAGMLLSLHKTCDWYIPSLKQSFIRRATVQPFISRIHLLSLYQHLRTYCSSYFSPAPAREVHCQTGPAAVEQQNPTKEYVFVLPDLGWNPDCQSPMSCSHNLSPLTCFASLALPLSSA